MDQIILHTTHFLKQCETIIHSFFKKKQTHTKRLFKGEWAKLYYTQHTFLNNVRQLSILFFEKQTHTKRLFKGG